MPPQERPTGSRLGRRNDPHRRDRIIDSCLESISLFGVVGTSHRSVAARAGVPLGAMTYYFDGMDELLREAFSRFTATISDKFDRRLEAASTTEMARDAVVAIILEDVFGDNREHVLTHELYTLAARKQAFRSITTEWMRRTRAALEQHFDPETARMLDALMEGLSIHRALDVEARDPHGIATAVARITNESVHPRRDGT